MPSMCSMKLIEALCTELTQVEGITKEIQKSEITLLDVRDLFDTVIEEYPRTADRLRNTAFIVQNKLFDDGIVKILAKKSTSLTMMKNNIQISWKQNR